jgi:hypothetical protein
VAPIANERQTSLSMLIIPGQSPTFRALHCDLDAYLGLGVAAMPCSATAAWVHTPGREDA